MNLNKVQDAIIGEFEMVVDTITNKFRYFRHLALLGNSLEEQESLEKSKSTLIKDTRSKIWLDASFINGKVYYTADSDNQVVKGILSLYLRVFSGKTPQEIINSNIYFLNEINLYKFMPPMRLKELSAMLQGIRKHALSFKLQTMRG